MLHSSGIDIAVYHSVVLNIFSIRVVIYHAVAHGQSGIAGIYCGTVYGSVILEDAVGEGNRGTCVGQQASAILQGGRARGVTIDDMETVEFHIGTALHGDHVVESVCKAVAVRVTVQLRTVVQRVTLHVVIAAVVAVIAADYL